MDQIAQIKQNLDIVGVIGTYVSLKKSGKNYKGLCPFHSEKTPSFMVSPELQIFRCFGCGESGDIFSFVQKVEGVDFPTALAQLAEKAGIKLEKTDFDPDAKLKKQIYWINEQAANFYYYLLTKHVRGKSGLDYFKGKRGLSDKTLRAFKLGYAPDQYDLLYKSFSAKGVDPELMVRAGLIIKKDNNEYLDRFRGRVMFTLTGTDGKVVGLAGRTIFDREPKYLNISETPVYHKSGFIYGLDRAKVSIKKEGAVFVEGNMDVISAHEAGLTNVVASSGTSLTPGQLKLVSRYTNDLTFCFDSDNAGIAASFRGIELAENMGFNIKVAVIPAGAKDLDELVKSSVDKAKEMLKQAVPAYDFLLFSIIKRYNKDSPDGKKKAIDELVPWFSRIKNGVLVDHYSKEIAKELDLNVETVMEALKSGKTEDFEDKSQETVSKQATVSQQSIEPYIITLLFHASVYTGSAKGGLDFMRSTGYKVEPQDFADEKLRSIVEKLRVYLNGDIDKFDPKDFEKTLDADLAALFENLYLRETEAGFDLDSEHLEKEFESALLRLKSQSARRRMHKLSEEIRLAEKSNDTTVVKKLTAEFENLKQNLIQ